MADSPGPTPGPPAGQHWSGRSRGGAWLFRGCVSLLPLVGARGAWLFSFVIASAFSLVGGRGQFGMIAYWRRLRPRAGAVILALLAFRQFASFGRILCDRLLVYLSPGISASRSPGCRGCARCAKTAGAASCSRPT